MGGPAMLAGLGWGAALAAVLVALWLRAVLARRAALVAEAAHELRAPLCAAGLALHGAARDPRRLAAAERELRRAGLALEDLSCAPLGRRARDAREVVDAGEVAAQVVEASHDRALAFGAGVYLDPGDAPAPVIGDRLRLGQAVANLVANAAEHGWGDVDVRVRAGRERVRIEVADQGAGPGPERVAAAVRGVARSRGARGHGLRIAAAIATRHGGTLRMAGRSVVLDLPRAHVRAAPAPVLPRPISPPWPRKLFATATPRSQARTRALIAPHRVQTGRAPHTLTAPSTGLGDARDHAAPPLPAPFPSAPLAAPPERRHSSAGTGDLGDAGPAVPPEPDEAARASPDGGKLRGVGREPGRR